MRMKNIFILVTLFFVTSVSAQTFTPVDSVKQNSDTEFVAYVNGAPIEITARNFVNFNQKKHFMVEFNGKKSFNIFVAEDEFVDEYLTVKQIGLSNDSVVVVFNNNTTYKTPIKLWLEVQEGQIVRHIVIYSSKRTFERYLTIDEEESKASSQNSTPVNYVEMPEKPKFINGTITSKPLPTRTLNL